MEPAKTGFWRGEGVDKRAPLTRTIISIDAKGVEGNICRCGPATKVSMALPRACACTPATGRGGGVQPESFFDPPPSPPHAQHHPCTSAEALHST